MTEEKKGKKPDWRIVQVDTDKDGKTQFTNVGGMWANTTKNGKEMMNVKIGHLKLQAYKNEETEEKK